MATPLLDATAAFPISAFGVIATELRAGRKRSPEFLEATLAVTGFGLNRIKVEPTTVMFALNDHPEDLLSDAAAAHCAEQCYPTNFANAADGHPIPVGKPNWDQIGKLIKFLLPLILAA